MTTAASIDDDDDDLYNLYSAIMRKLHILLTSYLLTYVLTYLLTSYLLWYLLSSYLRMGANSYKVAVEGAKKKKHEQNVANYYTATV